MSESFAGLSRRLAGLAGCLLGWRPAEFWQATPAELAGILEILRQARDERGWADPLSRAELTALMERDGDG